MNFLWAASGCVPDSWCDSCAHTPAAADALLANRARRAHTTFMVKCHKRSAIYTQQIATKSCGMERIHALKTKLTTRKWRKNRKVAEEVIIWNEMLHFILACFFSCDYVNGPFLCLFLFFRERRNRGKINDEQSSRVKKITTTTRNEIIKVICVLNTMWSRKRSPHSHTHTRTHHSAIRCAWHWSTKSPSVNAFFFLIYIITISL